MSSGGSSVDDPPLRPIGPKLATAATTWLSQPSGSRGGIRRIDDDELVVYQYSWMCNLLPHLGHQELYDKFDFNRPWTRDPNLTHTRVVVPEFLNPADNRQVWTGQAYRGLGLTHFVGVSGVEDSRNEVAAKLPRSDPRAGVFGYDEVAKMSDITDGTSQTVMMIGSGEFANPWVQGGGATVRGARKPYFDKLTGSDGSTRFISGDIDPTVFRSMCTIHGQDSVDASHLGPALPDFSTR